MADGFGPTQRRSIRHVASLHLYLDKRKQVETPNPAPKYQWPATLCSSKSAWHILSRFPNQFPRVIILPPGRSTLDGTSPCPFRRLAMLCTMPPTDWGDRLANRSPHQQSLSAAWRLMIALPSSVLPSWLRNSRSHISIDVTRLQTL